MYEKAGFRQVSQVIKFSPLIILISAPCEPVPDMKNRATRRSSLKCPMHLPANWCLRIHC
jgi:hypothetical protein